MATSTNGNTKGNASEDGAERIIESLAGAEKAALDAVRKFLDAVNGAFPHTGTDGGTRQKIIDTAFKMTEELMDASNDAAQRLVTLGGDVARRTPVRRTVTKRGSARRAHAKDRIASRRSAAGRRSTPTPTPKASTSKASTSKASTSKASTSKATVSKAPAKKATASKAPAKKAAANKAPAKQVQASAR